MNTVMSPVNIESRRGLDFKAGDTVRVKSKIIEKGKTRLQAFEGLVLARKHGTTASATFTVRKVSNGVGVERIFPLYSPNIDAIETLKKGQTRRAKLYFIRDKAVKEVARRLRSVVVQLQRAEKGVVADVVEAVEENVDEAIADVENAVDEVIDTVDEKVEDMAEEVAEETTEEVK
ncbi:50S ribosomal protein L19 [Candidatus Nomurabacteria bacterium RIFCSPHIGHO2_02_FULL_38_15]|uniref:50S ribosomal protein L19 n=1 Tax=Candidatus Nomurabacteria bacterium RIFCSPHIGHO2_02_FULL_38_15 TaxID=1801752 RepID=A0A1F6VSR3_9BACT|nr:MAG: 50S ribosomal protein L19 [Candidatus Nomurabacteria bacterium RIFCSPHIGHO2_02_FULL_38_15]